MSEIDEAIRATGDSFDALSQSLMVFQEALIKGDSDNE